MKLEKDSTQPLYVQLMVELKNMFKTGKYGIGDRIPTESELAQMYGVSRITVRKTIEELCNDGYLIKKQGKGTFVQAPKIHRKIEMNKSISFTTACLGSGVTPTSHVLLHQMIEPEKWHKKFLKLTKGEKILYIKRLRCADTTPIMIEELYFPANRFGSLDINQLENGSLFQILNRDFQMPETPDGSSIIEAATVDQNVAGILKIQPGDPVLIMTDYWTDENHQPVYISVEHIVGSRYRITV